MGRPNDCHCRCDSCCQGFVALSWQGWRQFTQNEDLSLLPAWRDAPSGKVQPVWRIVLEDFDQADQDDGWSFWGGFGPGTILSMGPLSDDGEMIWHEDPEDDLTAYRQGMSSSGGTDIIFNHPGNPAPFFPGRYSDILFWRQDPPASGNYLNAYYFGNWTYTRGTFESPPDPTPDKFNFRLDVGCYDCSEKQIGWHDEAECRAPNFDERWSIYYRGNEAIGKHSACVADVVFVTSNVHSGQPTLPIGLHFNAVSEAMFADVGATYGTARTDPWDTWTDLTGTSVVVISRRHVFSVLDGALGELQTWLEDTDEDHVLYVEAPYTSEVSPGWTALLTLLGEPSIPSDTLPESFGTPSLYNDPRIQVAAGQSGHALLNGVTDDPIYSGLPLFYPSTAGTTLVEAEWEEALSPPSPVLTTRTFPILVVYDVGTRGKVVCWYGENWTFSGPGDPHGSRYPDLLTGTQMDLVVQNLWLERGNF